jgi:hypothetical protein
VSVDTTGTMTDTGKTFVLDKFDCKATKGLLLVAVGLQMDNLQQVKDATFAGQTLTYLGEVSCEDKLKMEIWYLLNPPSKEDTISISLDTDATVIISAITLNDINQDKPFKDANTNQILCKDVADIDFDYKTDPDSGVLTFTLNNGGNGFGKDSTQTCAASKTSKKTSDNITSQLFLEIASSAQTKKVPNKLRSAGISVEYILEVLSTTGTPTTSGGGN